MRTDDCYARLNEKERAEREQNYDTASSAPESDLEEAHHFSSGDEESSSPVPDTEKVPSTRVQEHNHHRRTARVLKPDKPRSMAGSNR